MRASGVMLTAVLVLAGCRDAFQARPEIAAEARGQELRVDRLAGLMAGIKTVPVSPEAVEFIANMWVDHTLFAQAIAHGENLADSATAARVLWPEISELVGSRWHGVLLARRVPPSPALADSIYRGDDVRLLQHILIRVPPNSEPPARVAAKRKADMVLARLEKGEDFARLAREFSDDPGSKQEGGYYPPAPRGKYVTAFDSAGWSLAPGTRTGLVETPFGYHIIRRPPSAEVRDRMLAYAREQMGNSLDALYLDSLGVRHGLQVQSGAATAMRNAMADKEQSIRSTAPLAKYDTGALTVGDFMRWVTALGPQWAGDLTSRPDSSLAQFARLIAQNQLLLKQADSAGVQLSADEWASMLQRYQAQVDSFRLVLGLSAADLSDPATSEADRSRVAALKIESYWDRLTSGVARPRPIPGQLAGVLRLGAEHSVNPAGLTRTLELARELKAKADSSNPVGAPPPTLPGGSPVRPSPGGQ